MPKALTADTQATVEVFATTSDGTRAALASAIPLARGTQARLLLMVPHIVPYPLELERPVTSCAFVLERYRRLLDEMRADAHITVCLCRRLADAIVGGAFPGATIVIGGPAGRWILTHEQRLARDLIRAGYDVLFVAIPGAHRTEPRPAPSVAARAADIVGVGRH